MMRTWWVPLGSIFCLAMGLVSYPSCQPAFPTEIAERSLSIQITSGPKSTADSRLPLTFSTPDVFTVSVQALDENGNVDPTYNSYVRFSVQPGAVIGVAGPNSMGLNVQLQSGEANNVQVSVVGAYGDARIQVADLGYAPVNPLGVPADGGGTRLPQCANGIDDNHNGLIDYPADPGCYAANDDTEDGGSYAAAASGNIYFVYPRIADVQGVDNNGAGTPFPNEQVQINTEWNGSTTNTPKGIVVNGVASAGFFVTDIGETRGFASLYGYTYTAPTLMNVCDRLITLGGTAGEFYGFLELNYPTWSLEEWDPIERPCLVPEPTALTVEQLSSSVEAAILTPLEAGLVRVPAPDGSSIHIAKLFGPGLIPYTMGAGGTVIIGDIMSNPDATSCDYEGTGKIDFTNAAEAACEDACEALVECSEYSQFASNSQFQIVVTDKDGTAQASITADGSAASEFNPLALKGQPLVAFTGDLTYFSGGSQFTIQARCADDIVLPVSIGGTGVVLPSSPPWPIADGGVQGPAACVVNRAIQSTTN